jgi:hypothetical protein
MKLETVTRLGEEPIRIRGTEVGESDRYFPVGRSVKHQNLVVGMTAAGDARCLLLILTGPRTLEIF